MSVVPNRDHDRTALPCSTFHPTGLKDQQAEHSSLERADPPMIGQSYASPNPACTRNRATADLNPDPYTLNALFEQLELATDDESVEEFIKTHQLDAGTEVLDAEFWSPEQVLCMKDMIEFDFPGAEWIDVLNRRLHESL
ncbi:DUF2789 family protein [Nocardia sp. NPDC056100]|uniref:DUF2789 family protein n=1 Tax=Nocardia sp. NPDC056100 TaxID=3345712 RepID=UPI0035DC017E